MVNIEMSDAEYQDWLHSQDRSRCGSASIEEVLKAEGVDKIDNISYEDKISEHDAWWNSLTNEQKQQLFEEQEAMEKERIELSIEEMNHDLNFGK